MSPGDARLAALTGATGFIGGRLAPLLAARGWRLRCLARRTSRTAPLEALGAEIVEGDVADPDALARLLDGAGVAYHLAGAYDLGPRVDAAELERVNVRGTRLFLDAARTAGTPRAVYASTTIALGPVPPVVIGDEASRNAGPFRSVYERTKTEAHELALRAASAGMPLLTACPAYVYGPGDTGPGGRFLVELLRGRVPGLLSDPAWFSYVHVEDVAAGLAAMAEAGVSGGTYVLGGEFASVNAYAELAATLAGKRAPRLRFPPALARLTALALDGVSKATGLRTSLNVENVDTTAGLRWLHSWEKARRDLGYAPRGLHEGLPETVAWALSPEGPT